MVKASPIQTNMTAGEFSPLLYGHINLEKWAESLRIAQNVICLKQGPVTRRGGSMFVKEVRDSTDTTILIPFKFSDNEAYILEFGDSYIRFYQDYGSVVLTAQNITGITKANPAVLTYSGSDTYANGDEVFITGVVGMTNVNNKFFRVANVNAGANTFELTDTDGNNVNSTSYPAYSSGGTVAEVYQIASPYPHTALRSNGLKQIQYTQSADVIYLAHGLYATRALARTSATNWSIAELDLEDGPYLPINTTTTTLTLSGTSGSVTVTASATTGINGNAGFASTDVGRLIRWKDPANNWTWLEITAWTSTTQVTATIRGANASAGTATVNWRLGVYSGTTGYPRAIGFHQDRLVLAGCTDYPDRYDLSITGGFTSTSANFRPSAADGTVADDDAISGNLPSGEVNQIQWIATDDRGLVMGTESQEWVLRSSNNNEVLTPSTAKARPVSAIGSAYIKPIPAESAVLFAQRARRRVHELVYNFQLDRLKPRDLNILAEHITRTQITDMAFQQEPLNCVWAARTDGALLGLTYYPDQGIYAWHKHLLGGTDTKVLDVAVIPSSDGVRDDLWLIVERTINGTTRRYIEYLTRYYEDDMEKQEAVCVDSALTYEGSATVNITGLEHLEGQTVKVMRDGLSHPDCVVTNGGITLVTPGGYVTVGLGNRWIVQTQAYEAGATDGTAQGKKKRMTGFVLRLLNTLGLSYGYDADNLTEYDFNQGLGYGEDTPLFSGETEYLRWPGGYVTEGTVYLTDDGVFPATICAIMPDITTYDRG